MLVERLSQLKVARRIRRIIKNSQPSKIHLEDQGHHLVLHQAEVDQLIEVVREEGLKVIEAEAEEEGCNKDLFLSVAALFPPAQEAKCQTPLLSQKMMIMMSNPK